MSAARHPVADLLTDEMRERVRAAEFVTHKHPNLYATILAKVAGRWCCPPLGVAIKQPGSPGPRKIQLALGYPDGDGSGKVVEDFIRLVDGHHIAPEDVKPMLGCEVES